MRSRPVRTQVPDFPFKVFSKSFFLFIFLKEQFFRKFYSNTIFFESQSENCETNTTLVFSFIPSIGISFFKHQVQTEKKWNTSAKSKIKVAVKMCTGFFVWRASTNIQLTWVFWIVITHGGLGKNDVKTRGNGTRLVFKIGLHENFCFQKREIALFWFKIWPLQEVFASEPLYLKKMGKW